MYNCSYTHLGKTRMVDTGALCWWVDMGAGRGMGYWWVERGCVGDSGGPVLASIGPVLRSLFFSLSLDLIFLILSDDLIRCTFPDLIRSFYPDLIAQPSTCIYLVPYMHSPHVHCTVTYMRLPCVVHALTMCQTCLYHEPFCLYT